MEISRKPKVVVVHDQLTQYGGAEKTLEALLDILPDADIYTGYCKPAYISKKILSHKITTGSTNRNLGFLMPLVFESFDLRGYDIIISEGTAWPKGVVTNPGQLHISYIYTPPRFLYNYATEGQKREVWYYKPFLKIIDHFLRIWDYSAAQRPDYLVSISQETAKRVKKFYGRDSTIIYPPVDTVILATPPSVILATERSPESDSGCVPQGGTYQNDNGKYYLCLSRLAAYKNIDLLVQAFNLTDLKLIIAGTGREESRLKAMAKSNIQMVGFVTEEEKERLLSECAGFIFPTDLEDFGIVVAEALAHGKPVLCHRSGGPLEMIREGTTGMFFGELTPKHLAEKIRQFDHNIQTGMYKEEEIKKSAEKFSLPRFKKEFGDFVTRKWEEKRSARTS